ncbi:MAG TPA: carbamoyltransferase C-terminal domain-containing protein [Actinocrinis sp.]|nr:carbamoyltransferase C-terminal domain-containing protein [Actinocrinis sp.]
MNTGSHDPSAALIRDGEIVSLIEQERVSRRKRAVGESPRRAMLACLADEGITLEDVSCVAVGWDLPRYFALDGRDFPMDVFRERLGVPGDFPIRFYNHHLAHAASAFWTSGWDSATVVIADGRGEDASTTTFRAGGDGIEELARWDLANSLGRFYSQASAWTGLGPTDVGKFMGLAAYGRPGMPMPLQPAPHGYRMLTEVYPPESTMEELRAVLSRSVEPYFAGAFPFGRGDGAEIMAYADFAASAQAALETALKSLVSAAVAQTGCSRVVLAGGVAMNCSANGAISRDLPLDGFYVPPFAYDCGVAIGAALLAARDDGLVGLGKVNGRVGAYLGQLFTADRVAEAAATPGLAAERLDDTDLASCVAEKLAEGKLIGWYQGRAEVGQRALGARSILADPRSRMTVPRLNRVKGREVWRPLAPSLLAEDQDRVFTRSVGALGDYMLGAATVRPGMRPLMPATVHVDGSARPQYVRHDTTARYHDLIAAFRDLTGTPAVLNTSFNLAGEPIVCSPQDAVSTFLRSELDVLVLDDHVIERTG